MSAPSQQIAMINKLTFELSVLGDMQSTRSMTQINARFFIEAITDGVTRSV